MPRYPIRARKRVGRVGSYNRLLVIGGAVPPPEEPEGIDVYPYMGGGYYPAIGFMVLVLDFVVLAI